MKFTVIPLEILVFTTSNKKTKVEAKMMKLIVGFCLLAVAVNAVYGEMQCTISIPEEANLPKEWIDMEKSCSDAMRAQIQKEIYASYKYLAMGAHFSRDTINRPGFAEFFFHSAKEEREHGDKLIEYLSMRGELTKDITGLLKVPEVTVQDHEWADGVTALEAALRLETEVTQSIRQLIQTCEGGEKDRKKKNGKVEKNDYHLVDYLTGVYLEEQLKGQRELAGKLTTLKKMMKSHGHLAEFLFDKNL